MNEAHIRPNSLQAWLLAARPKTLTSAAVPVMMATALAAADLAGTGRFNPLPALLCFLFAFAMQVDANFVNDLYDFLKGRDDRSTRLGPKRACAEGWVSVDAMRAAIAFTTLLACLLGLPLILFGGLEMVAIGVFCVVFCFLYTTHLASLGLGDVLVLLFFGLVPVCATYYILAHTVTLPSAMLAVGCGLAVDCLLVVNNFRDINEDRRVGKNTLVVALGHGRSLLLYYVLGILAFALPAAALVGAHPLVPLFLLAYVWLHHRTFRRMKAIGHGRALNECLAMTARNILAYGVAVSLGLLIS